MNRRIISCLLGALLMWLAPSHARSADPVFDVAALQSTPLNAKVLKTSEKDGIVTEEVMFHSEMDGDKSVDIFAFFSYPSGAKKLPAFIWNQAGLGQASTYWTEFGAKRGYAALCIDFPIPGYRSTGGYTINSGLEVGDDPRQAPIYRGAVALLKAVTYLQSRSQVDADRIGMAGSSWGGFFTTLMAGIDSRLKAASAMFGTGSLQLGNSWWHGGHRSTPPDAAMIERWRTTLDPAWRLPHSKVPIAWFTGTNDSYYWLPAVTQTYNMAGAEKHLSLLPNWDHGLTPTLDEQVFAWLDTHLKGAPKFISVSSLGITTRDGKVLAEWNYSGPRQAESAELILSYGDDGNWPRRMWSTLNATMKDGVCTVELPPSSLPFYISGTVIGNDGFRYSTPLRKVESHTFGKAVPDMIEYNGCALWSGFEESDIRFLRGLSWPAPAVSSDARTGKQAAVLTGRTTLAPMLYTAGVPHRLTAYVKAETLTNFSIQVGGRFGAEQKTETKEFLADSNWKAVTLDFTPPLATAGLQATFNIPEGAKLLLDDISFSPLWNESQHP